MTQPDDEETKEHPAFPEPVTPALPPAAQPPAAQPPVAQPPAPGPTAAMAQPPAGPAQPMPPYQPPAQGWQSQPIAPPGWQPQPPAQWQGQPPYGTPAQGWQQQPQAWGAQPMFRTSPLVALAGLVLVVFGLAVAVLGGWTLTQGPEISRFIRDNDIAIFGRQVDRETMRTVLSPMPGVLMVLGVLQLLVGAVLFAHRGWARWLGMLLALVGLVVGVIALSGTLALVPGVSIHLMIAAILVLGYAFVVLALIAGGSHFRSRSQGR